MKIYIVTSIKRSVGYYCQQFTGNKEAQAIANGHNKVGIVD
ncbi:MAG TPA: hypothetical protein VK072_02565 [Candidatus Avamphibacillus sp.]|nr:hypothetical protein [Candidatus Avamphibacillus sp.]